MNISLIENVFTLFATIVGLLICLFHYIEMPKKGWLYTSIFFLMHLLSDYYWTTYTIVMRSEPEVSAFFAYLGWNVGYLFLLLAVWSMQKEGSKRYFNLLMLLPIPINVYQFMLYLPFGGLINNIWQGLFLTVIACICVRELLYCMKRRKAKVGFPWFHFLVLLFVISEYGMWTSSCFGWNSVFTNPYYYFEFVNYLIPIFFAMAIKKDYVAEGLVYPEKNTAELRFHVLLQSVVAFIIVGGCLGGYWFADWIKRLLPPPDENNGTASVIIAILFAISLVLVILIMAVVYVIANHYKNLPKEPQRLAENKKGRLNFALTLIVTLGLMIFAAAYNSGLIYKVSVTEVYNAGADKAYATSTELENYLSIADSVLKVTADTVDMMYQHFEPMEKIDRYIKQQTENQAEQFDENFTGIYAYVEGQYYDGLGWEPPADYDPETRDWYRYAVEAKGKTVIVPPYVDAQTGSVVITICKLLSDYEPTDSYENRNVVALDVIVNHIQDITEEVEVSGKGYAMIFDESGMIVAHKDREICGKQLSEVYDVDLIDAIKFAENNTFDLELNGEKCTLFTDFVMDQWYVVIVVEDDLLLEDVHMQLTVNIIVSVIVFALISFIYYLGYKNEQLYGKKMEEMKVSKQKQEYESEMLRLEKTAADEANKAKSGFLADMSHEIRTPINAILGMNEMILREAESKRVLEYARNVEASGRNLLSLINGILDFSKIEDGKMEIIPVRYSLRTLITYLVNGIMEKANAKGLEFDIEVEENLPSELFGDDIRINQVIMNLLTNAVKYTDEGSVKLIVNEKNRVDDKELIHVEVRDTGIGIREKDMGKLLESFERLDVIRNRTIEGTGLGMSITTRLLSLMGSELNIQSEYGKGSVFSFDLWQKIENGDPVGEYKLEPPERDSAESYIELFHAPEARILIVDDTKLNIVVAVNFLKKTEINIDTALSGEEAVNLADRNAYDVILMDQRMPGMNGTEAMRNIRALDSKLNEKTPVICLTADAIRGAKERYIAEGFTDYLTKPVEGRDLENTLLTYIPDEKIIKGFTPSTDTEPEISDETEELFKKLEEGGIDTKSGLAYTQGDLDFYKKVLAVFVNDSKNKRQSLKSSYDDRDWKNYSIVVHSLKSSSKALGAETLSELAKKLEMASKDNDTIGVLSSHGKLMQMYDELVALIDASMDVSQYDEPQEADEGEILEFDPEG
ncbi:MAG: response regulator [Lachnospiraceae bacterium]|nr:response regulator [Lachnospiraceae bacterium]